VAKVIQNGYAFNAGKQLPLFSQHLDYQFAVKYAFFSLFQAKVLMQKAKYSRQNKMLNLNRATFRFWLFVT
jgi:hypothetical protein